MRPVLSARQEECLRLTAFRTDREIAAVLGISEATVKKHVHEACQRMGVKRRKAALAMVTSNDASPPPPALTHPAIETTEALEVAPAIAVATGRLGYRPPPRSPYVRMLMIAGLTVVLAATTILVTAMVGDYHLVVRQFAATTALPAPAQAGALQ